MAASLGQVQVVGPVAGMLGSGKIRGAESAHAWCLCPGRPGLQVVRSLPCGSQCEAGRLFQGPGLAFGRPSAGECDEVLCTMHRARVATALTITVMTTIQLSVRRPGRGGAEGGEYTKLAPCVDPCLALPLWVVPFCMVLGLSSFIWKLNATF